MAAFKAETPFLAVEYNFDNKINIECKYDGFLGMKGVYFVNEKRLKASAKIFGDKLPQAFNGAAKYFSISDFNVDYSEGLLRIASAENKKESALYFELKTSGFHSLMNSRVSLNNVIVETADFSYTGAAEIDFNALNYVLKGRLVVNNLFKEYAALKMAFSDYSISAAGSFRDMKGGEKPEIRINVRSAPFLAVAQLASSFKIIFSDKMEAVFEDVKITDASANELMSATVEMKRDQASKQNYYYVSYRCSKLKEAVSLLKKSMTGEYKNLVASWVPIKAADVEKYAGLIDEQLVKFLVSGNFILKDSSPAGHEFEISAELKNKVNFLASFSADEKNIGVYKTRLMNYGFNGVTYKGECSIDFYNSRAAASFYNDRFTLAQALEIVSGEKNDIAGNVSADSKLIYEKGAVKLESKCKVSGAKIDVEKLGRILLKENKKTGGDVITLNIEIALGESNYIFNNSVYALVEGLVSVRGTPASPVVSGNIDVVRGKINYLNRSFDINTGVFKLSTLKNV
ncbi:MAG TPA: translocation/assembly module TamB domain-containing protein, partial [Candidatus Wallbacteria bacterium]|nr:translocation/assembly module TamB domain-containing protein [Candidatus Wallbacteria bacterium]